MVKDTPEILIEHSQEAINQLATDDVRFIVWHHSVAETTSGSIWFQADITCIHGSTKNCDMDFNFLWDMAAMNLFIL
jgi:hypothetical protein